MLNINKKINKIIKRNKDRQIFVFDNENMHVFSLVYYIINVIYC